MIDRYKDCYGQGEKEINRQCQNIEAHIKTLSDQYYSNVSLY